MSKEDKKKAEFERSKENLKKAATEYNKKTQAQKKAARKWFGGKKK